MTPALLIMHAWLRGNLGSFCITRRLIVYLRKRFPRVRIDLVSMPMDDWEPKRQIQRLVDRYMECHFSEDLSHLFPRYAAVLNAPGGGLQTAGDPRTPCMLRDATTCRALGIPYIFSGHSFHASAVTDALRGSLIIAREPETYDILTAAGMNVVQGADLAFLEPMPIMPTGDMHARKRVLLILRYDHFTNIALDGRTLHVDDREVTLPEGPLVLATSDPYRDSPRLSQLSETWGVPFMPSYTLDHLLLAIGRSKYLYTDRCHPRIFSALFRIPGVLLQNPRNSRDVGIQRFLETRTNEELASLAQHGLEVIGTFLEERIRSRNCLHENPTATGIGALSPSTEPQHNAHVLSGNPRKFPR